MRRKLFTLASALSRVLCAATVVLWVRSFWQRDACALPLGKQLWELASDKGRLILDNAPQRELELQSQPVRARQHFERWKKLTDLGHRLENNGDESSARTAFRLADGEVLAARKIWTGPKSAAVSHSVAHEIPVIMTAALPLLWLRSWRRSCWWRRHGFCPRCGYDLRATPARCPECGHVPEKAKATA